MLAAADARTILEDAAGFSWPLTVMSPAGNTAVIMGTTRDVAATIDPETGIVVTARSASCTMSIASLTAAGLGVPKGVAESSSKPWIVQFYDTAGVLHSFKVAEAQPDLTVGVVVCKLEAYRLAAVP